MPLESLLAKQPRKLGDRLTSRLRLVLGREQAEPASAPKELPVPARPPELEFVAYAEDCILSGFVRLGIDRLTDLLNDHEEFLLHDVFAVDLSAGQAREVAEILVERDELLLVHAAGPRGDSARRVRTRQHPVALRIGPYEVRGYLHCPPGTNPLASFSRRKPMVPLTEAWIEYDARAARQRLRVATVIVNRRRVEWIVEADDDEVEMPDLVLHTAHGPLEKDFTPYASSGD